MAELDEKGLRAARAVAGWYLGYPSWADKLIGAYLNPDEALRNLAFDKGELVVSPDRSADA